MIYWFVQCSTVNALYSKWIKNDIQVTVPIKHELQYILVIKKLCFFAEAFVALPAVILPET